MAKKIIPAQFHDKNTHELSFEEMAFVHLSLQSILTKDKHLKSTLMFIYENINHALHIDHAKQLMPYLSLCAILDQLGICYNNKDKTEPKFKNGLKRCLYHFANIDENDEIIDTLYAFRNGLLHNISLTSYDTHNKKHYIFTFNNKIEAVYQKAESIWLDGNYADLDGNFKKYVTHINTKKFTDLVYNCIKCAEKLNEESKLELRLSGGVIQLYFDYIRSLPIINDNNN